MKARPKIPNLPKIACEWCGATHGLFLRPIEIKTVWDDNDHLKAEKTVGVLCAECVVANVLKAVLAKGIA